MENLEILVEEPKKEKKAKEPKAEKKEKKHIPMKRAKNEEDSKKQMIRARFMQMRNEARLKAGLPLAYTEDEIQAEAQKV